jgi:hypothetical protein
VSAIATNRQPSRQAMTVLSLLRSAMKALSIVGMSVLAAIVYGIVHDQITVRVCVEYFTVAHPPLFDTTSPTILGLCWGIAATWWVGLALGNLLAYAARFGTRPKLNATDLVRPIGRLLLVMAVASFLAGLTGWALCTTNVVHLGGPIGAHVEQSRHARFMADWWAHGASYLVGAVGGLVLSVRTWRLRKLAGATRTPSTTRSRGPS